MATRMARAKAPLVGLSWPCAGRVLGRHRRAGSAKAHSGHAGTDLRQLYMRRRHKTMTIRKFTCVHGSGNPDLENVEAQDESDRAGAVIGELRSSLRALVRLSLEWLEDRECTGTEWMGLEDLRARGGVPDVIAHAERLLAEEDQQHPIGHGSTRKGGR